MKTLTSLKRYWPVLSLLTSVIISKVLLDVMPDSAVPAEVAAQLASLTTLLLFLALALSLPATLAGRTRLSERVKALPEAYVAAALSLAAIVTGAAPDDLLPDFYRSRVLDIVTTAILALLALAVIRGQILNEFAIAQPLTRDSADELERRFTGMARQLSESAAAFATLQAEVRARAHMAQELARQAEASRHQAERDRQYAAEQQAALDAVERLVQARAEPIVEAIERRSRRSQIVFLAIGAVAGTALQVLAERLL
ncbi:hypothetical protein OG320_09215 [Microbispora sp. NBC_01189]|uniref:hypothetical protein n=1 Tax=Microbispora sp. NBC_01189 TaxID=2903583 RepID=UPI002E0E6DA6|nr:hypothetical protein OG320_09215 [Microbispora sp. NBC_01189]